MRRTDMCTLHSDNNTHTHLVTTPDNRLSMILAVRATGEGEIAAPFTTGKHFTYVHGARLIALLEATLRTGSRTISWEGTHCLFTVQFTLCDWSNCTNYWCCSGNCNYKFPTAQWRSRDLFSCGPLPSVAADWQREWEYQSTWRLDHDCGRWSYMLFQLRDARTLQHGLAVRKLHEKW